MAGVFDLPVSVNELYETVRKRDGSTYRRLTSEARDYKDTVYELLVAAPSAEELRGKIYTDELAAKAIRKNYRATQRNPNMEKILLHISFLMTFNSYKSDLTNYMKLIEDAIIGDWLKYNDNRVISANPQKVVNPNVKPSIEVVVRECTMHWKSGDLFRSAWQEIAGYKTANLYSDPTLPDFLAQKENPYNAITQVDLPWIEGQRAV